MCLLYCRVPVVFRCKYMGNIQHWRTAIPKADVANMPCAGMRLTYHKHVLSTCTHFLALQLISVSKFDITAVTKIKGQYIASLYF